MSQTGADSMAKAGSNCEEIIKHFYNGVEVNSVLSASLTAASLYTPPNAGLSLAVISRVPTPQELILAS